MHGRGNYSSMLYNQWVTLFYEIYGQDKWNSVIWRMITTYTYDKHGNNASIDEFFVRHMFA